jgi:hypothetical protein
MQATHYFLALENSSRAYEYTGICSFLQFSKFPFSLAVHIFLLLAASVEPTSSTLYTKLSFRYPPHPSTHNAYSVSNQKQKQSMMFLCCPAIVCILLVEMSRSCETEQSGVCYMFSNLCFSMCNYVEQLVLGN